MVDYRRFLAAPTEVVLPHFGGVVVEGRDRRYTLPSPCAPGWWRFRLSGRVATPLGSAEPIDLEGLPIVRGHGFWDRLVREGAVAEVLWLAPEAPPRFAALRARRWPSGELIHDGLELESDAEVAVRRAFEDHRPIDSIPGVPATLRAAHTYAELSRAAEALGVPVSPRELRRALTLRADERAGFLQSLVVERERAARAQREAAWITEAQRRAVAHPGPGPLDGDLTERLRGALAKSGAMLIDHRPLEGGGVEVVFRFLGERFVALVDRATLQVWDAGICLSGHDADLTLESLPGVIREAIEDDVLVVTRHGP